MSVNFTPRLKLRRITSEKLSPGSFTFLNSSYTSSEMAIVLAMLYRRGERIHMHIYTMNQLMDITYRDSCRNSRRKPTQVHCRHRLSRNQRTGADTCHSAGRFSTLVLIGVVAASQLSVLFWHRTRWFARMIRSIAKKQT